MVNLYVMQDRVSGAFGSIFESTNDATVIRDFKIMASDLRIPDYGIFDTVILHLGTFDQDMKNPHILPAAIPCVLIRGDDNEIRAIRKAASSASDSLSV